MLLPQAYQRSKEEGRPPVNGATNGDARHHSEDEEGDSDDWQVCKQHSPDSGDVWGYVLHSDSDVFFRLTYEL